MEFAINLIGGSSHRCAVEFPSREVGISDIDTIRRSLDIPHLCYDRVDGHVACAWYNPKISIDESVVRKSMLFTNCNTVDIACEPGQLNKFVTHELSKYTAHDVLRVKLYLQLDERGVVDSWSDAGYPIVWNE